MTATLGCAFALCCATPVLAGGTLTLAWNDCRDGEGVGNRASGCGFNNDLHDLFPGFQLTAPLDSVISMELVLDLQHADPSLPDWWQLQPGGCRAGGMVTSQDFSLALGCTDPWNGQGASFVQGWLVGQPAGGPNQARLLVAATTPSNALVSLQAGVPYHSTHLVLRNIKSSGTGACSGCNRPACLVLNGITLRRLSGGSGETVEVITPGPGNANWVTWQGGTGADCQAVPTRNATWGRLKSLYR